MSDRSFFAALILGSALVWAVLQASVTASAAPEPPRPVVYRATVAVAVAAGEGITVCTVPSE